MPADERVKNGSEKGPSTPGNFVFPILFLVHKNKTYGHSKPIDTQNLWTLKTYGYSRALTFGIYFCDFCSLQIMQG
jgi:hypothetical protein